MRRAARIWDTTHPGRRREKERAIDMRRDEEIAEKKRKRNLSFDPRTDNEEGSSNLEDLVENWSYRAFVVKKTERECV